jgi:hypothetical protein
MPPPMTPQTCPVTIAIDTAARSCIVLPALYSVGRDTAPAGSTARPDGTAASPTVKVAASTVAQAAVPWAVPAAATRCRAGLARSAAAFLSSTNRSSGIAYVSGKKFHRRARRQRAGSKWPSGLPRMCLSGKLGVRSADPGGPRPVMCRHTRRAADVAVPIDAANRPDGAAAPTRAGGANMRPTWCQHEADAQLTPPGPARISRRLRRDAFWARPPRLIAQAGVPRREAHLSTVEAGPQASARVSCPHGDRRRPQGAGQPPGQGPQAPVGLIARAAALPVKGRVHVAQAWSPDPPR